MLARESNYVGGCHLSITIVHCMPIYACTIQVAKEVTHCVHVQKEVLKALWLWTMGVPVRSMQCILAVITMCEWVGWLVYREASLVS